MSDCKDKKCKDCNEDYLQGMLPCVTLPELCADGETCEETYNANCVRYTGSAVVCGTTTVLSTGMTTQEALISLANAICLSGGGGLVDLTELEECCATNTTNITNLQTNLTIVNTTLTTISTQITTINTTLGSINTQITELQECCDASLKLCEFADLPFSYATIGCQTGNEERIAGQDFFYVDKHSAGLSNSNYGGIVTGGFAGKRLQLPPQATASAFYIEPSADSFGLSWNPATLTSDYFKSVQAVYGAMGTPREQTILLTKDVTTVIGLLGSAGQLDYKDRHINAPHDVLYPLLMSAIGVKGVASQSTISNIGGDFLSLWRNFQTSPNTAIRGKASGSDLNSGYDIEVGLTTDTNRTNVGGKIIVKSGAGGTNHGLKIDVSQALGVTYAIQLKDTTAAAGKFLKAVDSDGNAIWDTVTAGGTVPPGVVSNNNINGTINYVTKWTAADQIGDSQIIDNGSNLSIGASPLSNSLLYIRNASKTYGIQLSTEKNAGFGAALIATGVGGVGAYISAQGVGGANIGASISSTNGLSNYAVQLIDTTSNVAGRYLRNMTTDGKANWANINITEVTNGLSSTLLGAPNGIATLDNNSKLVMSQMPISVMDYKGTFNPTVPSPPLQDGVGNTGDVYAVTAAGTYTFGAGNTLTLGVGDWVIYNGTKWEKTLGNNVGAGTVTSVGLTTGTTGTDVNVSNSPITTSGAIALNIPTIGVAGVTRGLLSISDWNLFNSKISGSGQLNQVATWTPDGATLGYGVIQDNGSTVGIGTPATITAKLSVDSSTHGSTVKIYNHLNNNNGAISVLADGVGSGYNIAGSFVALNSTTENLGIFATAQQPTVGENIGIRAAAINSTTANYAIQLQDPSSLAGRFLKCATNSGKAQWANITAADISGAVGAVNGTLNYVAKFTPDGTTIGNSLIQDNDTAVGVNMAPSANAMFFVKGGSQPNAIAAQCNVNNGTAIYGQAFTGTGTLYGVTGYANSATSTNNIGLYGKAVNAVSNYPIQLEESISSTGKFLKSVTGDGKANWAYLPDSAQIMCSDMTSVITVDASNPKAYWAAPCDGKLTDAFASLRLFQVGGATFTVLVKSSGVTLATLTFPGSSGYMSTNPALTQTFTKGGLFEFYVTQVGDGSAKGLMVTLNYVRT